MNFLKYLFNKLDMYIYKCVYFQERTRSALLETLYHELHQQNLQMYGILPQPSDPRPETASLFDTFRRAISGKVRSQSMDSHLGNSLSSNKRSDALLGNGVATNKRNNAVMSPVQVLPPVGENESSSTPSPVVCGHGCQ